jgi:alpha-ribazole phosphatase
MTENLVTSIDLLRHGEPAGGIRYRGSMDDPLSECGWEQMRTAVGEQHPWDVIVSSPLRRCVAFARELAERHSLPLETEPAFREISFGAWEGRTTTEIDAVTPDAQRRFWSDPLNYPPPDGEPLANFAARVSAAWRTLLERHAGRHVLVVAHGGVIRMVLCQVLEMSPGRLWRLEVPYASCSRVRVYGRGIESEPLLVFHGKGLE